MRILLISVTCLLLGCTTRAPVRRLPPPPTASTTAVTQSLSRVGVAVAQQGAKTSSAKTRVETIIRTVEKIQLAADPATAAELQKVQQELFRVQMDLRDAQLINEQLTQAVTETQAKVDEAEKAIDGLRVWGIDQQTTAEANANGWRTEEAAHLKTKAELKKQVSHMRRLARWIAYLVTASVMLLAWSLGSFLPLPYRIGLAAGGGALAGVITYWII